MIRVVGALAAGLVLAVGTGGTAFAAERPDDLPYGNCGTNSKGGLAADTGLAGKGHGGMKGVCDVVVVPDPLPPGYVQVEG